MRILFCDDDRMVLEQLQSYVAEFFQSLGGRPPEYAAYESGEELLRQERRADIAFLDVEMPGISGIRLGAELKKTNPYIKILIVTAYPDYLDEAMRFQVFRYLSKPIEKERLFRNLKEAVRQYNAETEAYPVATKDGILVRRAEEIVCVEALERKVWMYTTGEILVCAENMDYWRQTLTVPCFFSPHRSYIINMRFVNAVGRDKILLKYSGGEKEAYLTKRKYTEFRDTYLRYLESAH